MVSFLIIAHAPLATALRDCASHVYGGLPEHLGTLDVLPSDDPVAMHAQAEAEIARLNDGAGVLVLTDIAGATPGNIAQSLAGPQVKVIAGVNVPMLVRAVCYRALPLAMVMDKAQQGGTTGVQTFDEATPFNPCAMARQVCNDAVAKVQPGAVSTMGSSIDAIPRIRSVHARPRRTYDTV